MSDGAKYPGALTDECIPLYSTKQGHQQGIHHQILT